MSSNVTIKHDAQPTLRGSSTPTALVDYCLNRIEEWDGQIRAWAYVDAQGARAAAAQLDQELARGNSRGPLHGMPIGVKDIVAVEGMPTRAGSPLTSPSPATRDAPAIQRLRAAGAIILGKTITTEWACFDPPPTRNPWNLAHTPGGSSSGSAAAVAMEMCVAAVGSQTGGSIIRPGSYCGVYSCKPTYGEIPLEDVIPLSPPLDHLGAFARTVRELHPVIMSMMGEEAIEPTTDFKSRPAPRLGVVEDFFLVEADAAVAGATRTAIERLSAAGAHIRTVALPKSFSDVHSAHRTIMVYQAARYHQKQFTSHPDQYGPCVSEVLREGARVSDDVYRAALVHKQHFQSELVGTLSDVDALLVPATPAPAPGIATTGDLKFNSPWTYSGLPVVSLPVELDGTGMPIAIQLIGQSRGDRDLFSVAAWCEELLPFRAVPPAL